VVSNESLVEKVVNLRRKNNQLRVEVERLREQVEDLGRELDDVSNQWCMTSALLDEARAEVERLREDNARLTVMARGEGIEPYSDYCLYCGNETQRDSDPDGNALRAHIEVCEAHPLHQARATIQRVRDLAETARPGLSLSPLDCTDHCAQGDCDCSGVRRVVEWTLDPAAVLTALEGATDE
jgi:hypothetical protein